MPVRDRKFLTKGTTTISSTTFEGYSDGSIGATNADPASYTFGNISDFTNNSSTYRDVAEIGNLRALYYDPTNDRLHMRAVKSSSTYPPKDGLTRGWTTLKIGSTTFNESDAVFSENSYPAFYGSWRWDNITSSPFSSSESDIIIRNGNTTDIFKTADTRTSTTSQTQNVTNAQCIRITVDFTFGLELIASNCEIDLIAGSTGGSSSDFQAEYVISFKDVGDYRAVFAQNYLNRSHVITGTVSSSTEFGIQRDDRHGLTVNDANGKTRMSIKARQPRIVGSVAGTGSNATFSIYFPGFNNPSGEWLAVNTISGSNYSPDLTQSSTNYLRMTRCEFRARNFSYQVLSGNEDYRVIFLRF